MPLDQSSYANASDYHSALDQEDAQQGIPTTRSTYQPVAAPTYTPAPHAPGSGYYAPPPRKPTYTVDDEYTYDETRPGFSFRPQDTNTDEGKVYWSDYGKAAWNNVKQTGADLLGAVNYATGQLSSDPHAMQWAKDWRKGLEDSIEATTNSMSPAAKEAYQASLFGNDPNAPKVGDVGWGRYLGINLAAQVPTLLTFVLPGAIGAKIALKGAQIAGAGAETAATVARAGGQIATTGFFGGQNAGAVYNQIHDEIGKASDSEMMGSALYAEARRNGASELEAKEQVTNKVAGLVGAGAAVVGAVAGSGMTSAVTHGALGTAGRGALTRAGIGAAEGAGLMGAQGAANEALTQTAGQQAGTQQGGYDIGKIIASALSSGALGAVFGAGGGLLHRGEVVEPTPKPAEKGIQDTRSDQTPPDQRAAIEAALPPATTDTGGQGIIPGLSQQGEMFAGGEAGTAPPALPIRGMQPGMPETATQGDLLSPSTQVSQPGPTQGTLPLRPEPPPEQAAPVAQPTVTVPQPAQPMAEAGPVTGAPTTPVTGAAAPVTPREPAGAAAGTQARPAVDVKNLPSKGMKRAALIDALATAGEDPKKLDKMIPKDLAALFDRRAARGDLGIVDEQPAAQPTPKLAAAKPIEQAAPVESKPAETPPVGELPLPDQPGGSLSPQAAVASAEPAAPAEAAPKPVGGFTTEKGSTYQVHDDGTTTRDKAFRPEHGEAEQGPQPRSEHTFYVSSADAQKLGEFQTKGGGDKVLAPIGDGRWGVKYTSGKDAGKVEARTVVTPKAHPEAGAIPVELWNNGERVHFGNKITELHEPVTPGVKPEPEVEAKVAALQTKTGLEQKVEEKPPVAVKAPEGAKAIAVSKRAAEKARMQATGVEAKPVDPEAAVKAQATRDAALKEAEAARKQEVAEKLALRRQQAAEQRELPIRTQDYGAKQEERPDTTDRERIQGELVDRIARGEISGADAHAEYEQGRRKGGRQRREEFDTVAKGIERELATAQNKDVELALLKQQQEHEAEPKGTPKQREKRTNDLEEQLKHFDPTRIERLQTALKEIRDPVGHAADRTSPLESTRGPKPAGIDPMGSRYTRLLRDPRLSNSITRALKQAHQDGIPLTLHNLLRTVSSDPLLRNEARPLVALAERFLKISRDIPVMSGEHAYDLGHIDAHTLARMERGGLTGHYHPTHEHIVLSMHRPEHTLTTLMHEASHSITQKLIDHMQRTDPSHPQLQALDTIRQEIHRAYEDSRNILGPETRDAIEYALNAGGRGEAVYHELHTALLTDPKVQGFVSSQQASPQFTTKMRALGYGIKPGRSVWQAFTGWMRKALGMPEHTSGSEATIFDHIMRPVQDITEHAAQYNERTRPRDAALERHAAPLERASRDYLRDAGRGIADRINPSTLPDRLRSLVLGASNRDAIVAHNSDILPGLRDYQVAGDKIAQTNTEAAAKYGDKVRGMLKQWGGLSDQKQLGQLMNDASIGEAHLGDNVAADANKHLTEPEQQASLRELQARYDKLSPAAKSLYNEARDLYKTFYKETREAELKGSLRSVLPDMTPAQEDEFVKAARNQKSLADFMTDPDNSDIAKSFGTDWSKNRELAKIIAKAHSYGYTKGDYFPQRRYGQYVVKYGKDEQQGVEFFDRKSKAEDRRKELIKQYGPQDVWQVTKQNQKFTKDILATHPAVGELETALASKGFTGDQAEHARNVLASILVNHMANSAAQKARLRRQGVIGAETNHARVLANEFVNHTNRQGYLLHGAERQKAIDNLWSQQHDLERPGEKPGLAIRAAQVIQSLEKRQLRPEEMNSAAQRTLAHVNGANYAMQLQSLSHMVTGSMEAHTNSVALLGGRHGVFRSSGTLAKNLAQAMPMLGKTPNDLMKAVGHNLKSADWNVLQMLTNRFSGMKGANKQHLQALHDMLAQSGLVDHTMISDLRRQMNPEGMFGGKVAGAWERFTDMNAIMAHSVDAMNRYVSAKTAFDLEFAKTKDVQQALDYAEKTARRVMPNYASQNRELITSPKGPLGIIGAPLMQFKRYGLHMYAMMGNLVKESIHAGTPAERWEARKSLALLMGTHAMMAGVLGLPTTDAVRYIMGAYDLMSGKSAPHNYENDMRGALTSVFGPTIAEAIARGLPHLLFGADLHRRVSLNNLLEMPELSSFGKSGIGDVLLHLATGATGENLQSLSEGAMKLMQGDLGGAKALLPRMARDPMKAIQLASQGVTDSRGHTILPPAKLSPYDIGLQAVGFQPSKVSETREKRNAILEARTEQGAERSKLEQRYLSGNASDKAAAWQAIVEYNSRNPTARITRQQLLQQQQAEKRSAGTMGLRLPKKGAAALMQAGAFANAP